jgi:hypothetical protein
MAVTFKSLLAAMEADPDFAKRLVAQPDPLDDNPAATEEMTRLFRFIGTYVVGFQDIEAKLDQIIALAIGLDRWHISHAVISYLSHAQKIDLIQNIVQSSAIADEDPFRTDWLASFEKLFQRLKQEATRRNKIVHSLYIFDFLEIGAPPIRSKRKRRRVELDQEAIDTAFIASATQQVAELSFDFGVALTQLRHWSEKLATARPNTQAEAS